MSQEFIEFFNNKLYLHTISPELKNKFLKSMEFYLKHSSNSNMKGRSYEYIVNKMTTFIDFLDTFQYSSEEKVLIISNDPSLLNALNDLYGKFLFLGIIENKDNTFRRDKLLHKTRDFRISLSKMYARYLLACECGYDNLNWNLLVHSSDMEFANVFVRGTYYKPYQLFDSSELVHKRIEELKVMHPIDLDNFVDLDVNQELVLKYESKGRRRGTS